MAGERAIVLKHAVSWLCQWSFCRCCIALGLWLRCGKPSPDFPSTALATRADSVSPCTPAPPRTSHPVCAGNHPARRMNADNEMRPTIVPRGAMASAGNCFDQSQTASGQSPPHYFSNGPEGTHSMKKTRLREDLLIFNFQGMLGKLARDARKRLARKLLGCGGGTAGSTRMADGSKDAAGQAKHVEAGPGFRALIIW